MSPPGPIPAGVALPVRAKRLPDSGEVIRVTVVVLAVVAVAALVWFLADVLAMVFAAVLVAVGIRSLAELLDRFVPLPLGGLVVFVCLLLIAAIGLFILMLGSQVVAQIQALSVTLPATLDQLGGMLGVENLGDQVAGRVTAFLEEPGLVERMLGVTAGLLGVAANGLLVLAAGFYLALRPDLYSGGALHLLPPRFRSRFAKAFDASGRALRLWLLGQLVSMLLVGILTTAGLMVLGVPSALALGLLAAVMEFIPIVGPWLSALPAILSAFTIDMTTVLWVAGLYIVVQQIEGNIITPLVQRRAVDLPPAVTIFALVAMAGILGPLGLVLATPIAVILMVFITQLYVRDTLHEAAALPGERHRKSDRTLPAGPG